jgi:GT2 family glycosyltransferase
LSFVPTTSHADCAVVTVTYNNSAHIEAMLASLRAEATSLALRVIVVDNGSSDRTREQVASHDGVTLLQPSRNLGYAGAINAASVHTGGADYILVLNPDIVVAPGAVSTLLLTAQQVGACAAVPRIRDWHGETTWFLRREPSVLRSLGDAVFGQRWPNRPAWLGEVVYGREQYERPHPIDWATGAAMLVEQRAWQTVGPWDERFFLYSEETDYARRLRAFAGEIWYTPEAEIRHLGAGSGTSDALSILMTLNRIRYARKHHGPVSATAVHLILILKATLRLWRRRERGQLRALLSSRPWQLPAPIGAP